MVNAPSKSQMYSLRVTEKVCPEARQGHLLLDKPKSTGVEHHSSEQQNPSMLLAMIMDYVYVEGTREWSINSNIVFLIWTGIFHIVKIMDLKRELKVIQRWCLPRTSHVCLLSFTCNTP